VSERRVLGIVGSEAAKFTKETEADARSRIHLLIASPDVAGVVSGACHLGGVDLWAAEIGRQLGKKVVEHAPKTRSWTAGYMPRNLAIARDCTECHCFTVKQFPVGYTGMKFPYCYHCKTNEHIKSGGCWTVKQARKMGKDGYVHVIG